MITIPEHTLMNIINAAQEDDKKIVGVTIIPPDTTSSDSYGFGFHYSGRCVGE